MMAWQNENKQWKLQIINILKNNVNKQRKKMIAIFGKKYYAMIGIVL